MTKPLSLPFIHLNLRRNPFGEVPREEVGRVAVVDVPPLSPGDVLQIMGEAGRGKTTTLLALLHQHPTAAYEYLAEGETTLKTPLSQIPEIFLLDEAQRLSRRLLKKLFLRAKTLVLATHEDLSPLSPRPMRTITIRGMDASRLTKILERRVEWARRGPGPVPRFPPEAIHALLDRYGDDLRSMEDHLYLTFQSLEALGDVIV